MIDNTVLENIKLPFFKYSFFSSGQKLFCFSVHQHLLVYTERNRKADFWVTWQHQGTGKKVIFEPIQQEF
jgi:hypothetical protein